MDKNAPVLSQNAQQQHNALTSHLLPAGNDGGGSIFAQLTGNPFFTAGFGLAALAAAARFGQKGIRQSAELLRRRMLVDIEITRHDASYDWLLQWMTAYQRSQLAGKSVTDTTKSPPRIGIFSSILERINPRLHHLQVKTAKVSRSDGSQSTHFSLVPGHGRHLLRYKNAFILVNRQREKSFDLNSGTPFETITMTTLYTHRHIFEKLFTEAHELAQHRQEGKTSIYTCMGFEWKQFGEPKRKRPLDSVVLEAGVKERIVEDLESFIQARTWYLDRGIPYRRGYLLYGPPGTGKSSFIQALAGHFDFNIAMLNVSQRGLTDDKLNHLLTKVPSRTIVLLEDADAAFINRKVAGEDGYSGATVTFSGLLNALDGVASAEERIIFLTTNHIERLDEALVRPGRVDMTVRLGEATEGQIEQLWDRFYADFDGEGHGKRRFMQRVKELQLANVVSTAALQGLFLYNKEDMDGAITMLADLGPRSGHAQG
ncbi:putative mitochondrial chaperone BCS1 [Pseudovirgaria hyperparasitica]|uniref:Putative mitochondrial chaperone BCS1 n=1 Tax=Pseudovirgaria hyperparasitica TaxID=470096 RepID=A0A6A6WGT7_9PEZI|nr:putative mitochondrial chaperone BCS1 [Pseudovirgaria hyperparasitica]KAF2761294.1 putative mitochondrial chaperone BCS1 [Pseudovirgaria hyperparasitica]